VWVAWCAHTLVQITTASIPMNITLVTSLCFQIEDVKMREAALLRSTMPMLLPRRYQEDCPWRGYVLFLFVRYDSFAAQNVENLIMTMKVHLSSGARRKSDDSNPCLPCPNVLVNKRLRADRSAFKDSANSILRGSSVYINHFQHHHVLPTSFSGPSSYDLCGSLSAHTHKNQRNDDGPRFKFRRPQIIEARLLEPTLKMWQCRLHSSGRCDHLLRRVVSGQEG